MKILKINYYIITFEIENIKNNKINVIASETENIKK